MTCDCGGELSELSRCSDSDNTHVCLACGTSWRIISEHEQALIDACKLPEIQLLVKKARDWGVVAEDEAKENYDTYLAVLAPFAKLVPEEE